MKPVAGLDEIFAAGLPGEVGVRVVEVPAGSAAAKAGLVAGDVILKCAGKPAETMSDLQRRWSETAPGAVPPQVWREQQAVSIDVRKGP